MKDWLKTFTREQITFGGCAGIAVIMLLVGLVGGTPVKGGEANARGSEYRSKPSLQVRGANPKFENYWGGRNVFVTENSTQLPVPTIAAPMPRGENPVAPLFRPRPPLEIYNRVAKAKYPSLQAKPLVAEADLPAPEVLAALQALQEPPPTPYHDASEDRERETCVYFWNDRGPTEGSKCTGGCSRQEDATDKISFNKGGSNLIFPRSQLKSMQHCWRNIEQYQYRAKKLLGAPQEADKRIELAQWCIERGMYAPAQAELQRALEVRRGDPKAVTMLGDLLETMGNYDAALAHYQMWATPASEDLWFRMGEVLRKLGLTEAALDAYGKGVVSPLAFRSKIGQARMYAEIDLPAKAVEIINDLFSKFSGDAKNFTPELRTLAQSIRGRAKLKQGLLDLADLDAAAKSKSFEAWNALGVVHALEGRWKDAAAAFAAVLQEDQYQLEAWTNLATIYLLAGKVAEAESLLAKAVERDPAGAEPLAAQALALLVQGKVEDAGKRIDAALTVEPDHVYSNYLKGDLLLRAGKFEEALGVSREAVRRQPSFLPAFYGTGSACLRAAESELAEAARRASLGEPVERSMAPAGPLWGDVLRAHNRLTPEAWRASAAENVTRAGILFKQLADLDPDRINLQIALACTDLLLGQPEPADARLKKARDLVSNASLRADPIVEYAEGYRKFHFGSEDAQARIQAARSHFRSAAEAKDYADAGSLRFIQEAAAVVKVIDQWLVTALAMDETFTRDDAAKVRGKWTGELDDRPRVSISISGRRCVFSGEPGQDWIPSILEVDNLRTEKFLRLEATFLPEPQTSNTFEFGVSLYGPKQGDRRPGVHVAFDRTRRLRKGGMDDVAFRELKEEMRDFGWENPVPQFKPPMEIRLRLERRTKDGAQALEIQIWDPAKRDYVKINETQWNFSQGPLKIAFWTRGEARQKMTLGLDDVRIYEKRK